MTAVTVITAWTTLVAWAVLLSLCGTGSSPGIEVADYPAAAFLGCPIRC